MILRTGVIALLFTLCLSGCSATEPVVWKAQNVSFTEFKAFDIQPVFNATGKTIDKGTLSLFTAYIKEQFKLQNLQLIDTPQTKTGVLIVQSHILVYETNKLVNVTSTQGIANRKAECTLRTRLVEKSTGKVLSEILTIKEIGVEAVLGEQTQELILKESAAAAAKEVAKMMPPTGPGGSIWQKL